ncbi:TM2 domain-containing protein [Pseudoduganella flava]|uniref:NINE protein n=1 Tax=Pseudoduganella flava TaxID=871742 RepID=A0A562Q4F6_9BURK|nr:NINE protein [Pseudoduganella flava]QGZ41618.1 NINE protein [Pseudoduganella flava]TWI51608.1 TM2 domain-containing protein [Pseudoduganella flava]
MAQPSHKNKTLTALLAFALGGLGIHRFYLKGLSDRWGWLHAASLPACGIAMSLAPHADWYFWYLPLTVSMLAGFIEALVLGLTPDERWDAAYNAHSGRHTASRWPLAVIVVATLMVGAGVLIATLARLSDLLYTGGAYG